MDRLTIRQKSVLQRIEHEFSELINHSLIFGLFLHWAGTIQKKVRKNPRRFGGDSSRMTNNFPRILVPRD
jgi:hypothetical protein